jgi:adenine-specific DNA methylase
VSLETHFDPVFAAKLSLREKQIQQNYRPIIGIHKWFARRPGTLFRNLLLAEYNGAEPIERSFWHSHRLQGLIADPFMGGGTPVFEANRLGFGVVATDVNPMAYWVVRQSLSPLDISAFVATAEKVASHVEVTIGKFYQTECVRCGSLAPIKYFLLVKTEKCSGCGTDVDLFPGYLLAEAVRHPKHVVACASCGNLNELKTQPTLSKPAKCTGCGNNLHVEGPARKQFVSCPKCSTRIRFINGERRTAPPEHRMWAIEYHCPTCRPKHIGRFFKKPDHKDLSLFSEASDLLSRTQRLPIPEDPIPKGDETDRLHRWGYRCYRDMFNQRQLLGLGVLLRTIQRVSNTEIRYALLTVFSDFMRYQNMLCRYDTYALKCQDVFSVHGFPVGLVQCENSILGIPRIGSGAFRHFVEKYRRAKEYCEKPFETQHNRTVVSIPGERICAEFVDTLTEAGERQAMLSAAPATQILLRPNSLDGVFTDPPYFANVQYAELMDFCYVWLRKGLSENWPAFRAESTRSKWELTGNVTLGRDLANFTEGLSQIFQHYSAALKTDAPFVFTYHHNDPEAYIPVVVAILDACLDCSATLPAVAEMSASIHILGTGSSVLDTVFVCRHTLKQKQGKDIEGLLSKDAEMMRCASVRLTRGDLRCLLAGHLARLTINSLRSNWDSALPIAAKMAAARQAVMQIQRDYRNESLITKLLEPGASARKPEKTVLAATV